VFELNQDLARHRTRDAEMDILCEEIHKTKERLSAKLSLRSHNLVRPGSHPNPEMNLKKTERSKQQS
jgi:hypothetical protein